MNKNKLKIFATTSRTTLLSSIKERLEKLKVDEPKSLPQKFENGILIDDVSFTQGSKYKQREELIKAVNHIGKEQIIEEISYTWFNRIVAIYFMQVNGYLKYGFNILPSSNSSRLEPDVVVNIHKANIPNLDKNKAIELSNAGKFNELYNYILLLVCNDLHTQLPFLFEKLDDYSELLIPSDLLIEGSLIQNIAKETDVEDWKEVEVIGWLYQFYITEKKDEIFASKKKIDKDSIGPATQLFTPKWIVKYMVENSVGKIWVQSNSKDIKLIENWKYFLKDDTEVELAQINKPEDITVIDPSMGSGHILVYAFDVLYQIYLSQGYQKKDIVRSILKYNLFGIDIDQRATQLASFALMMKACEYDSEIINEHIKLHLIAIQETNTFSKPDSKDYPVLSRLYEMYIDALEYGSILEPSLSTDDISKAKEELINAERKHDMFSQILISQYRAIVEQTELLSKNYIIAITNPPYMGGGNMSPKLSKYVKDYYPDSKSDLFSVFIERCLEFASSKGLVSMITMHSWMFLSSFENLRKNIIENHEILSMVHLGARAFEEIGGEVVQTTTFVIRE